MAAACGEAELAMAIYVDVSSAVHGKAGLGRYADSLARALLRRDPERFALFYNRSSNSTLPEGLEWVPARSVRAGYKPWRMAVWLGHLAGLSFERLLPGAELFHATEHLLLPLRRVPTVLTVHDMIFKLFPEHQKRLNFWYLNAAMPLYCRRATAIITVSEWSKQDIVSHYGLDPAKVTVIHEAASPEFALLPDRLVADARRHYGLPERFLIHVGTIEPRKNLARLIEALARLRAEGLAIPLVAVGSRGWLYEGFFRKLEELGMADLVHLPGYVPAGDLPLLYNAASAAILPSVYEGFGLPLLEAMACGAPTISSNTSSLTEIGGEAAHYFDPYDIEAMASAIRTVWCDAALRREMRRRGLRQAARFSWDRAAAETCAVYDSLLS
jgi:glycosyltransferase involved in cell wall biosynthesis